MWKNADRTLIFRWRVNKDSIYDNLNVTILYKSQNLFFLPFYYVQYP